MSDKKTNVEQLKERLRERLRGQQLERKSRDVRDQQAKQLERKLEKTKDRSERKKLKKEIALLDNIAEKEQQRTAGLNSDL